jgi:hypothetical protein
MLDRLDAAVKEVVEQRRIDYLLHRIITYPLFICAFLVLSALTWATMRAVRYVRQG